jgi:TrpR family transcriptional regulator, trp operon repressor
MADFSEFINIVSSINSNEALLKDFLMAITTQKERQELSQRIEIVKRLIKGVPQFNIAAELGVGVGTVTRGSKELSKGSFKVFRQNQSLKIKSPTR